MKSRRQFRVRLFGGLLALGSVITACGDDDDASDNGGTTAASATAGPVATTAAPAGTDTSAESDAPADTDAPDETEGPPETDAPVDSDVPADTADAGATLEPLVAAAQEEGGLTVYTDWSEGQYTAMVDEFEERYGISVEVVRDVAPNLGPAIEVELESGEGIADVITFAAPEIFAVHGAAGDFGEPMGPAFEGLTEYDVEQYAEDGNVFPVGGFFSVFVWNTDVVPEGIHDWSDFLDPSLSGKIGVIEPSSENNIQWYLFAEEQGGDGFIEALAAQEPLVYASSVPMNEAVVSTELYAVPRGFPVLVEEAEANGAPIDYSINDGGLQGSISRSAVLRTAPHPNAAWLWMNFVVSEEGQTIAFSNAASVLPGVGLAAVSDFVEVPDLDEAQIAEFQQRWRTLFVD